MFHFWPTIGHKSRAGKVDAYPYDLDASERITRPKTGIDIFPSHSNVDNFQKLGSMNALCPQQNTFVWGQMIGKNAFGPIINPPPTNLQWQITVPTLNKQLPSG